MLFVVISLRLTTDMGFYEYFEIVADVLLIAGILYLLIKGPSK